MKLFILSLFITLIYMCIYSIVDRICKCVENKHMAEAYSNYVSRSGMTRTESLSYFINNFKEAVKQDKTNDQKDN